MWGKLRDKGTECSLQNLKIPGDGSYLQGNNTNEGNKLPHFWNSEIKNNPTQNKKWTGLY